MKSLAPLLCAALGCVPTLERSETARFVQAGDIFSVSGTEFWDREWARLLPSIRATPMPEPPAEYVAPELSVAWRDGAERGRASALRESLHSSTTRCFFPRTPIDLARVAGFKEGFDSVKAWKDRIRSDRVQVQMVLTRPRDVEMSASVPLVLCFSRNIELTFVAAEREGRRAVVALIYSEDYAETGRRADLLDALIAKGLGEARPGAIYLLAGSEGRSALLEIAARGQLRYDWVSPDALSGAFAGETEADFVSRLFRTLP